MACVPLLLYGIVSIDTMGNVMHSTICIFVPSFFAMLLGFCLSLTQSKVGAGFILAGGFIMFGISLLFLCRAIGSGVHGQPESESAEVYFEMRIKRRRLTFLLFTLLPSFPIVYILCAAKVLDQDLSLLAFTICNISTKVYYVVVVLNSHSDMVKYIALAELNEARRNFLRYVMHEVRVPLNSISAGIGVLENYDLDNEGHDTLTMMSTATIYMADTLNNILSMQKIEEGKFELVMGAFSVSDLLDTVKMTLHGLMMENRLRLEMSVAKDVPPSLIGDRYRLEHILANLLSNAAKFSPECGKILVSISLDGKIDNDSCNIKFAVTDEGPGMTEAQMRKLFKPFTQLNPHELQKGGGSGVGLSICKRIVEMHGGTINVTSVVGQGSTFYFIVPCGVPQDLCGTNQDNALVASTSSYRDGRAKDYELVSTSTPIRLSKQRPSTRDSSYISLSYDDVSDTRKSFVISTPTEYVKVKENFLTGWNALVVDGKLEFDCDANKHNYWYIRRCHVKSQAFKPTTSTQRCFYGGG